MKKVILFLVIVSLALIFRPPGAFAADEAYVIGRITGTYRDLPGYFFRNTYMLSQGMDYVEFYGFRFVSSRNDASFLIRPNHQGYFYQKLPGGEYTLTRKRADRPGYREPGTIEILSFEVEAGSLVNLGTINLILEGKPSESLFLLGGGGTRGRYIYSYHYERETGDGSFHNPLGWFTDRKRKVAGILKDKTYSVNANPTLSKDSSELILEEIIPFPDR